MEFLSASSCVALSTIRARLSSSLPMLVLHSFGGRAPTPEGQLDQCHTGQTDEKAGDRRWTKPLPRYRGPSSRIAARKPRVIKMYPRLLMILIRVLSSTCGCSEDPIQSKAHTDEGLANNQTGSDRHTHLFAETLFQAANR